MTRNSEALASFVAFCEANPDQRFWQALNNWSRFDYILGVGGDIYALRDILRDVSNVRAVDTYYIEGLDGTKE